MWDKSNTCLTKWPKSGDWTTILDDPQVKYLTSPWVLLVNVLLLSQMSSVSFPEPPTQASLADAQRSLNATRTSVANLSSKIDRAEAELAQIVHDSKITINQMQEERACLEEQLLHTMAYLSPIRRLPADVLSDIFMWSFEDYSCQAWILASVCSSWRRLALRMPRIWSKVRCLLFLFLTGLFSFKFGRISHNVFLGVNVAAFGF